MIREDTEALRMVMALARGLTQGTGAGIQTQVQLTGAGFFLLMPGPDWPSCLRPTIVGRKERQTDKLGPGCEAQILSG